MSLNSILLQQAWNNGHHSPFPSTFFLLHCSAQAYWCLTLCNWNWVSVIIIKLGPCHFFFSKFRIWKNCTHFSQTFVPAISVAGFGFIYHEWMAYCLMISKIISYHGLNKTRMDTCFYIIWNFAPWLCEYRIAIRFLELNEHLRNYQMGPAHDWGPCLKV